MKQGTFTRDFTRGISEENDTCIPRFFMNTEEREFEGVKSWEEVEMVEIIMPGNSLTKPIKYVSDIERNRWPKSYAAFKDHQTAPISGTPLDKWPRLNGSMIMKLKSLHFRTVEDVARMSEQAMHEVGMGARGLKLEATAFLDNSQRMAITNQAIEDAARFEARTKELASQNEYLQSQIALLGEQVRHLSLREQFAEQNMASTPAAAPAPAYRAQANDPFASFAEANQRESRAGEIAAFAQHRQEVGPIALPNPEPVRIDLSVPPGTPKKRGPKSKAQKEAEAAEFAARNGE